MAQIKRKKVSNKAVKGQKREISLLKDKKFWVIVSSVVAGIAVLAFAIWLIIYLVNKNNTNENPDYFGGESTLELSSEKTQGNKVKFKKCSYEGVIMHTTEDNTNEAYVEFVFVYATDLSVFYADDSINNGKDSDDEGYVSADVIKGYNTLFNQLIYLQYEIDTYNKTNDRKAALYIVDTSVGDNTSIYADEKFGGSEDSSPSALFFLYTEDGLQKYSDVKPTSSKEGSMLIFSNNNTVISQTCVNNSVNLMKKKFVVEE